MAAHVRVVEVPEADQRELQRRVRDKGTPAWVVERARIVLLAAEAVPGKQITAIVGCAEGTVVTWRGRYAEHGLAGLELTLTEPPTRFGATHWSSRLLSAALAEEGTPISHTTIARIWHRFGVQPWRAGMFKFSTDPALEAKVCDVVGLYLHPPAKAVVLCVDEKSQIQALQRTAPTLPVRPRHPEAASFDHVRHGTTTLFATLGVATGKGTEACTERHRHQEFGAFLQQVAASYPAPAAARGHRQPVHPHASGGARLARAAPAGAAALHPDLGVLADPGRGLLLDPHPAGTAPRQLPHRR
jgi:transposase